MKYSTLFTWPNYVNRDELADEFYMKATSDLIHFPFDDDFAIFLCANRGVKFCYIFIDRKTFHDDSIEVGNAVEEYLKSCSCPEEQEQENAIYIANLNIGNISENLSTVGVSVLKGMVRRNNQFLAVVEREQFNYLLVMHDRPKPADVSEDDFLKKISENLEIPLEDDWHCRILWDCTNITKEAITGKASELWPEVVQNLSAYKLKIHDYEIEGRGLAFEIVSL